MTRYRFFYFLCSLAVFLSCNPMNFYEKSKPIPNHKWKSKMAVNDSFSITDTTALYNIYVILRHTDAYKYNNIWLETGLQAPGDSLFFQKMNIPLSDDATGWYGSGMDDIWEVRSKLSDRPRKFSKPGTYKYVLKQLMRDDPLPEVMSVGLRVEKAPNQ